MTITPVQTPLFDPWDTLASCGGAFLETGLTLTTYWAMTTTLTKVVGLAHLSLSASVALFGVAVGLSALTTYQIFSSYAYENKHHLIRSIVERFFYGFFLINALPVKLPG